MAETGIGSQIISSATVFIVSDIHKSAAFYRDKLGFEIDQIWGDPPSFAIAGTPRASIMLKQSIEENVGSLARPNAERIGGLWDAYIWIQDMSAIMEYFDGNGVAYSKPEEMSYGCTEITVTDPDGYLICFGYCP